MGIDPKSFRSVDNSHQDLVQLARKFEEISVQASGTPELTRINTEPSKLESTSLGRKIAEAEAKQIQIEREADAAVQRIINKIEVAASEQQSLK